MPELSVLVDGGKASAGAPLGPALGPMGVNIGEVVASINEKTKAFAGMKVPVKIVIDVASKSFDIEVGSPPTSALVKKELHIEKGAANPKTEVVGNMTLDQVKKVADMKMGKMNSYSIRSAAREVVGVCDSMGVQVEGVRAKEIQKRFDAGEFVDLFGAPAVKKEQALEALPKAEPAKPALKHEPTPLKGAAHKPEPTAEPKHEPKVEAPKPEPKPVAHEAAKPAPAPAPAPAPKAEAPKAVVQAKPLSAIQEMQRGAAKPKPPAGTAMTHIMAEDRNTLIIRPKKKPAAK